MENKKAFSLLLMPTTTYGNYLELLPYTYMYYDYFIYLRFKTAEQGRFGYNEVPVLYVPAAATELHKNYVTTTVTLKADTIGTVPYLRDAETHYYT